jgi:chromosome segregation ATPase
VSANKAHVQKLEAETKAYLKAGDRTTAAKFALELQKAKAELASNEGQLQMHETSYGNNLKKIQHANEKLIELREKITKYDAELKMSSAEAEIAKLSETFDVNLTTDFGEIESVIQQKIDQNRGKVRVAADLSNKGIAEIQAEERMQGQLAEQALSDFEVELGLKSPETTPIAQAAKDLGPAASEREKAADKQTS